MGDVLIVIDVQRCFLQGGTLGGPFANGEKIKKGKEFATAIDNLIKTGQFGTVYFTKDVHSTEHASFGSTHKKSLFSYVGNFYKGRNVEYTRRWGTVESRQGQVMWPDHCVGSGQKGLNRATNENELGEPVAGHTLAYDLAKYEKASSFSNGQNPFNANIVIIEKGFDKDTDSYSAIADALGRTTPHVTSVNGTPDKSNMSLLKHLKEVARPKNIYICGIARDYCVFWTAMDILDYWTLNVSPHPKLHFLYDLTKAIDPKTHTPARIYKDVIGLYDKVKGNIVSNSTQFNTDLLSYFEIEGGIASPFTPIDIPQLEGSMTIPNNNGIEVVEGGRRRRKTHRKSHSRRKTHRAHRHGHRVCHKKNCRSSR